ncbi:Membrane protein involved in the export of O-antigen and teichoic acid [Pustulibacterium marinum]|uniref:Membrane protein involved in the export of O-antigen and teichoic acid n=1 Tax=Pustulibacterium marinum TaxID=1224947 RepID=A0A1I7EU39_9FLAO|nr:polysaccharide biosynthesis C-terminal domain-containing protein [Pustulibacterium marinum]SFU27419.1 Membrane protein involved in the export of O-antigen and teichoic acid [Pustulibacterium marinum]
MSALQKLFKTTFIYGIATVLPRILGLILTPFYINELRSTGSYGIYSSLIVFSIFGNVILSYGMETAFFRFINKSERKAEVQSTALTALLVSSLTFFVVAFSLREEIAFWLEYKVAFIGYVIGIMVLDALVVIPFVWYRNQSMPIRFSVIKITNVLINFGLNLFLFLALPKIIDDRPNSFLNNFVFEDRVHYIFISNLVASGLTLLMMLPLYKRIGLGFDKVIFKKMFRYAFPVLIAGIAYSINEGIDRLILRYMEPNHIADEMVGIYAGCYKLGVFMGLFVTAFKLGVEPFFFSQANKKDAKETYANITLYFSIFGSFIVLFVVVYADLLKMILIPRQEYWVGLWIVPFILMANLCLGIYHNLSVWYKVTDKTWYGAYISLFGAVITLVLNFLLIPLIHYKGAAIATLAAYASMMLLSFYFGQKNYKIPYNTKKIGLYLGTSMLYACLSFYVFNRNIYVGSIFVFLFLLMIYSLEGKALKKLLKK